MKYYNENGEEEYCIIIEEFYFKKFDFENEIFNGIMKKDMVIQLPYLECIKMIGEEHKDKITTNLIIKELEGCIEFHRDYGYMIKLEDHIKNIKNNIITKIGGLYNRTFEHDISNEQFYKTYLYYKGKVRRDKIKKVLS